MEVEEHFYTDDPAKGPPDAKTTLDGVDYYFLGNGRIQAAVQICTSGEATPVGLLIMDPRVFGPKRSALTFDKVTGLKETMVRIQCSDSTIEPDGVRMEVRWTELQGIPAVHVAWRGGGYFIDEFIYCPDRNTPQLIRDVRIKKVGGDPGTIKICTGTFEKQAQLKTGEGLRTGLLYELAEGLKTEWIDSGHFSDDAVAYWKKLADADFSSDVPDRLFGAARRQLPAVIEASGMMDGSIWQYNLEWVRDQAMVIRSLVMLGDFETSRTMLSRLLTKFVTDEGDTIDSGKTRPVEEIELDQNGALLHALKTYVDWSGDEKLVKEQWPKIRATAEFPLKEAFRHEPSGLMHNRREYWERHALHGIEDGMELTYQFFVSAGLSDAASLARLIGHEEEAARWESEAERLKQALLHDEKYSLVENGEFIKRRGVGGEVQEGIQARPEAGLPGGIPLLEEGRHLLNPDTSSALPIAHEFIDPGSDLASTTLNGLEALWMEGGYSRYNVTSEPDSPGPWPFASLFMARACLEAGDHDKVWRILNWLDSTNDGTWFEFYGPRPVPPYPQVGITPWTWAEILCFFIHHLLGVRPSSDGLLIRPRLLSGMEKSEALLRIGGHKLHLLIRRTKEGEEPGFHESGNQHPYDEKGCVLDFPSGDLRVEAVVP